MSITKPSVLSQEDMDRLLERLTRQGATITMVDPRVTSAQTWILGTIGAVVVAVGAWGVKSINDLNQTMTIVITQNTYRDAQLKRVEDHVQILDGRVVTIERKGR